MTLFEYLAVSFSLVLSFAVVRVASALPSFLDRDRRDPLHTAFALLTLITPTMLWWNLWSYHDVTWTYPAFAIMLSNVSLVMVQAAALVPANPETVLSWRTHFERAYRGYFAASIGWYLLAIAGTTFILDMSVTHPARWVQGFGLVFAIAGFSTPSRRVHAVVAIVSWVGVLSLISTLFAQPGALLDPP